MNELNEMRNNSEQTVTLLEWCAGYTGIGMGIRRVVKNLRTIGYSEIEEYPVTLLASLMERGLIDVAPVWTDLRTFPYESFRGKVDILVAGFPCQPFSHAGKRAGDEDPRHLWPHIARAIGIIRPRYCFFENVEGILSAKLKGADWSDPEDTPVLLHVLREMERLGYRSTAGLYSAAECGAPHNRKRVFICGMDDAQMHRCKCGIFNPDNIGSADISIAGTDIPWPTGPSEDQQLWEPPRAILVPKRGAAAIDDGDDEPELADSDSGGLEGAEQGGGEGGCTDALCEGGEQAGELGDPECVRLSGRGVQGEVGGSGSQAEGAGGQPTEAPQDPSAMVNPQGGSNGQYQTEQQGRDTLGGSGEADGELGNTAVVHGDGSINNPGVSEQPGQVPQLGNPSGQEDVAHNDGERSQELGAVPTESQQPAIGSNGDQHLADTGMLGQAGAEQQAAGLEQLGEELGNPTGQRLCGRCRNGCGQQPEVLGQGPQSVGGDLADSPSEGLEGQLGQEYEGPGDGSPYKCEQCGASIRSGEVEQSVGGDAHGSTARVGCHRLPDFSDYQLEEIRGWLQKTPRRAEELKMLGNGVVPAVAEKAWRTLVKRLWDGRVGV